ncbi:hypothetical protein KY325_03220, partial [Candidatus Woesearchaeota archaeon]|nr:hypothetical protein [Candidatus Woesearchaeota archaeon]
MKKIAIALIAPIKNQRIISLERCDACDTISGAFATVSVTAFSAKSAPPLADAISVACGAANM